MIALTDGRRSASRDANLRLLVAEFQRHPLCRDDIQELCECSTTHVLNYIKLMGGMVKKISGGGNAQYVYKMTANRRQIAAFLAKLPPPEPKPKSAPAAKALGPTRHVHILADDTKFYVRLLSKVPQHPELHRAFWARVA